MTALSSQYLYLLLKLGLRTGQKHPHSSKRAMLEKKVIKGTRGMPRLPEAKKDVISCDKLRVSANAIRSVDFRMGQPNILKVCCQKDANALN